MSTPSSFRRSPRLSNCHGTPASGTRSATKGKLPSTPFSCISAGSVAKKKRHTPVATPSSRKRTSTPENTLVNNGHDPSPSGQEGRECVQTAGNDDNFDAHGSAAAPDAAAASALSLSSIKPEPVRSSERRSASRRMDATTSGGSRTRFGTYYSTTRNERDLWLLGLCQSSGKKRKENVESLESNDCKDKNTPIDGRKSAKELVDTAKNIANNDDGDSDSARNEDVSASSSSRNASNSAGTTNPPPETTNDRKTTPATPLPDVVQSSETILMATKPRYSPFSPANNDGKRSFSQTISFLPPPEDKVYKINDSERKLSRANDKVHKSTKFEKKWDEVEVAPTVDELRNIIEKAKYSVNTSSSLASIKTNNLAPSETAGSHETWPTTNSSAPNKCSVEAYSPTLTNGLSMTPESKRHPIRKYAPRDNVVFKSSRLEKKWDEVEVAPSVEELRDRIRKAKCHSVTTSSPSSSINTKNDLETLNAPNSRATIPTTSFLSSPPGATNDLAPTDTYAAMNAASMTPDSKPKKHGKSISPRSRGSTAPKSVLASPAKSLDFTTSPQKSRPATSCNEVKPSPKRQKSTRVKSQIIRNNPRFAMSLESYGTAIANSLSSPARTDILSPNHSEKQQPFISPGKRSSAESALHFLAKKTRSAENSENIRGGLQLDDRSKHFDKSVDKRGPLASYSQNAKGDAISKVEDETNLKQSTLSSNESDVSLEKMIRNYVPANRNDEKWLRNFQKWRSLRHADAMDKSKITVSGKTSPLPKGWVRTQRTYYRLLKESNQLGMSDARITLLEKAGFSWGGLHSKISMFEKDPEHSDEEKIHDDDNEDDVSITKKNVKKKTKQPDGSNEENDVFRLLKPGQTNSLPKQLSKKHVDIDPERRTSSAEDGEPGTKRKSPRLSCPTEFFHNTVMSNTTISSKRKTSNRDRKKLDSGKKAAHLPWKPEDSELGKAVDFECRRSKCEQPRVSNRVSSTKLSESLSSTSNVKSDIKGKPSEISVSNTEEKFDKSTKSIVIENQCLNWKKKKRRGGRHSVSSFFDLNDRKNDPERSKSGAKQSVLSHKMLEEQLKKTMKLQRKRSEKKKLDEKSIAETTTSKPSLRKTNNHKSDTAPSTLRQGDNECLKKVNDESNESKISIDSKDDTSLQINRATSPSSPESPLRAIKLLSTPPEAKPQTSSRSYKIKTKDPQEQAVKSVSECDRALISKEDSSTVPDGENVSTHNPLKASEEDELRNDTIMTAQLLTESREETLSLTEELNPSLQEEGNHMKGTPQTAAKMKTLAGTPEFATFSPLSLNSPLGRTHLLEKSFEDGTPESLKNAYASNTITENPVVKENAHSVGIESTVNTQENLVWSISNRDIAASSTDQVTPWLNDSVGNISGIPSTPHNVETRQELVLAQQQYQEKMAEFGRLELEAKMIEERMREIESKIKDLDGTSARSMDRSLFSMEIPECPPLEWTYNDKTGFAPARNYDVASRYDDKQYFSTREKIRMKSTNKIRYDSSRRSERSRRKRQSYEFRDYSVDRRDFSENGRRQNRLTRERSKRDGGMQRREHRGNYAGPENKIVGTSARKRLKECATRKKRSSDLCSDELNGNFSKPISRSKKRSKIDDQSMGSISEAKNFRATTRIKMNSEVNDGVPCELVRDSKKPLSVIRSEKIGDTFLDRQVGFTRDAKKSTSVPRPKKRAKIQTQSQLQIHTENVNTGVDCSTPRQKDSPKATSNLTNKSSSTRKGETRDTLSDSSNVIGTRKPSLSIQKTSLSSHSFGDVKCTELIVEGNDAADTAEMAKNTTEGNHMIEKEQNSAKERHPNCNDKCEVENERRDPLYWLAGGEQSSDDESWDFDGPMILPPPPL